jgi:hypothetical protein
VDWRSSGVVVGLLVENTVERYRVPPPGELGLEHACRDRMRKTIFAMTGRLWMLMVMHVSFDLTAVVMIYWDLESKVAHWVFR